MRGRKPKPAVKSNVVVGPFPAAAASAVASAVAAVAEPDWLMTPAGDGEWGPKAAALASARWRAALAQMVEMQTFGPENESALQMLAVNYARWQLAEAHVARHGPIVPAPRTGVPMRNPYLEVANGALERALKIEAELGLPPSARGRVAKRGKPERVGNKWDTMFGG